jgi:LacI family repressor for deo operon, udp, cdd, tsx, nupC, and nupG
MSVTHKKIAEAAGVSQSTVSKALSDSMEIPSETAAHIRRIAEQLGYFEEKLNQRRRRAGGYLFPHVAILVPEVVSWYYAHTVELLQQEIERIGGMAQVYLSGFDDTRIRILLDQLEHQQLADCVICIDDAYAPDSYSLPLLFYGSSSGQNETYAYPCVRYNGWESLQDVLSHLRSLGHTLIGFIGENYTRDKEELFRNLMQEAGLPCDEALIYTSPYRFERIGHDGVRAFHIRGNMPTALITAYDEVAFGAIQELKNLGYRVPEDVSVVGCNDVPYAVYHDPPLTTVSHRERERCAAAIRLLCRMITDKHMLPEMIQFRSELIIRESTAPCREKESKKIHIQETPL